MSEYGYFTYSFVPHPTSDHPRNNSSVRDLFLQMTMRQEMDFNPRDFNYFREELAKVGIELCEISRRPWQKEEPVL